MVHWSIHLAFCNDPRLAETWAESPWGVAMDAGRFDTLARLLDANSRRRVLSAMTAVAVGISAPLGTLRDAEAKKKKKKKKKKPTCEGSSCTCRTLGSFCHGICNPNTACPECCSGYCGFYDDTNDSLCCVQHGAACPGGCKKGDRCHGCCNNGICDSSGHCFSPT